MEGLQPASGDRISVPPAGDFSAAELEVRKMALANIVFNVQESVELGETYGVDTNRAAFERILAEKNTGHGIVPRSFCNGMQERGIGRRE